MAKKTASLMAKIGVWSYVVGFGIAVLMGLFAMFGSSNSLPGWTATVLIVLGLVVGFLNVSDSEIVTFLLGALAFVLSSSMLSKTFTAMNLGFLAVFMDAIVLFTAPAALVVAFKALYSTASDS